MKLIWYKEGLKWRCRSPQELSVSRNYEQIQSGKILSVTAEGKNPPWEEEIQKKERLRFCRVGANGKLSSREQCSVAACEGRGVLGMLEAEDPIAWAFFPALPGVLH